MKNTKQPVISLSVAKHVAQLANIPLTQKQLETYQQQLEGVLEYISKISETDTSNVEETSQVNNLQNVYRDDVVNTDRMFSQEEALANAKNTSNGYFVVDAVLE